MFSSLCRVTVPPDRFTTQEDKDWFEKELIHYVTRYLGDEYTEYVLENHYFVDFMRDAPEPTGDETEEVDMELPKVYEPVQSLDDLQDRLNMFLSQYNEMIRGHGMDLVFFQDAVEHLIKVTPSSVGAFFLSVVLNFQLVADLTNLASPGRKCAARRSRRVRETVAHETGIVYRWLQDVPRHTDEVFPPFSSVRQRWTRPCPVLEGRTTSATSSRT